MMKASDLPVCPRCRKNTYVAPWTVKEWLETWGWILGEDLKTNPEGVVHICAKCGENVLYKEEV